jgi:hypothetical protein
MEAVRQECHNENDSGLSHIRKYKWEERKVRYMSVCLSALWHAGSETRITFDILRAH